MFDKVQRVQKVRSGETLRFRDSKGRLTKFDARKKLVAEIWRVDRAGKKTIARKTDKVLNKTKSGRPVPQKFSASKTKKQILFLKNEKQGPRLSAVVKNKRITIDARFTIEDNIEARIPEMIDDIVKFSKRGNGGYMTAEFMVQDEDGEEIFEVVNLVLKGSRAYIIFSIAQAIIARLYKNKNRMSNIKKSPLKKRARYLRSLSIRFQWTETKQLKEV